VADYSNASVVVVAAVAENSAVHFYLEADVWHGLLLDHCGIVRCTHTRKATVPLSERNSTSFYNVQFFTFILENRFGQVTTSN
jgi:hypothetical protein